VRIRVTDHLERASPEARRVFRRFAAAARACGRFTYAPAKTRVGFQVRMIFADVEFRRSGLHAYVILSRRRSDRRFTRIEQLGPSTFVHHFELRSESEVDGSVREWLCEAYRVGRQEAPS
jgi:Domain of unknown function (DUF5655)